MKKVYTLLLVLVLSGVMGSCVKLQTIHACKNDCNDKFATELFLLNFQTIPLSVYEKSRCYDRCEGK